MKAKFVLNTLNEGRIKDAMMQLAEFIANNMDKDDIDAMVEDRFPDLYDFYLNNKAGVMSAAKEMMREEY